ncbi:zinc transporter ZupT [Aestuariimicrobium ganziense]|uniref:zinc transporter ZupT n=1 Tax=Aestuariimicrobium ganziense TaxID=2773677 RepID=UPI0019408CE5|nr:zinc transporter ZupT [Aestuariimicrobium ganziense]
MLLALLVSLLAGLATSVGGFLALSRRVLERTWLAVSLAFAAGAMLLVSLMQVLPLGIDSLSDRYAPMPANALGYGAFFVGILLVLAIDRFLPGELNPNETEGREAEVSSGEAPQTRHLLRSGLLVALVLSLHNFPEGMATFFTTYTEPQVGITLAVAIAIHNVPEGIAVAAPVYAATRSRTKALAWATVSGLTEPLGGLFAALLVSFVVPQTLFGMFYALVAGMMVFLAVDELLPGAWRYQTDKHQTIYGMLAGMVVVALSLVLFAR